MTNLGNPLNNDTDSSNNGQDATPLRIKSLRTAINQYCKFCIYDDLSEQGNWRKQVAACTMIKCPLYEVRPISKPRKQSRLPSAE